MRKKGIYTTIVVIVFIAILAAVYFNFIKNTEDVYEGTLVWMGACI